MKKREGFSLVTYLLFTLAVLVTLIFCVCAGSVSVPVKETVSLIWRAILGAELPQSTAKAIILNVRLPRVICVGFVGASLSICGAAMQGLLRNPLADGTTLGVSSGASIGAILAIAFGVSIPGIEGGGTVVMAIVFAFLALMIILSLAYKLDYTLSTNTIILIGVIFTMFAGSIISLLVTFAGDHVKSIMFWTMGSLSGSSYGNAVTIAAAFAVCAAVLLSCARELNAFAISEDNARNIGVNVRRVKLIVLIAVSALIGVSVSIGGTIGFVGLVIPHMTRMITGPNHKKLLPASIFAGAVFLMLADLVSRVILSPLELPIGVVTSFIGSITFVYIFYSSRKGRG
ncbi:MAG TPA: iron ABC transporter permease [Clostridiales bacterium]|jgi:iron complex transport system permease protein|nr:iron ABC transporter permease [Clostridiales bacterium]